MIRPLCSAGVWVPEVFLAVELLLELEELLAGEGSPPPPRLAVTSLGCKLKNKKKIIIVKEEKNLLKL